MTTHKQRLEVERAQMAAKGYFWSDTFRKYVSIPED
jgi:hypothetical protein